MELTTQKPHFSAAYTKANEILLKSTAISDFPYSSKDLVKELTDIPCRSYGKAKKYGVDIDAFGSESAVIVKYQGKEIIFYDETKPQSHIGFSILHELGHKILEHDFNQKNTEIYHLYEVETNFFAAQLLMPEQIIRELSRRNAYISKQFIQTIFGVSATAAEKRLDTLAKTTSEWHSRSEKEFDDLIMYKYKDFLDRIKPKNDFFDYEYEYECQQERNKWYY